MSGMIAILKYEQFKRLRKSLELRSPDKESPVVFILKECPKTISLGMVSEGREIKCFIEKIDYSKGDEAEHDDYTDFNANIRQHTGEAYVPAVLNKKTHDFGDNTTWQYGVNNSLYIFGPMADQIMYPDMFIAKFHEDDVLAPGSGLRIVLWESFGDIPCPDVGTKVDVVSSSSFTEATLSDVSGITVGDRMMFANTSLAQFIGTQYEMVTCSAINGDSLTFSDGFGVSPPVPGDKVTLYKETPYNDVLFSPLTGQNEGFMKVYPKQYDPQQNEVWYYLKPNPDPATNSLQPFITAYKATVFVFDSVSSLRDQSKNLILKDGVIESVTSYKDQGLKAGLSNALMERVEIYMEGHTPITKAGIASLAVLIFKSNPAY